MHLTVSARFLISSGRGGRIGGLDFTALGWKCNIVHLIPDNLIFLTIQYTYKYIQIHWKMEKDPRGIKRMTFVFIGCALTN